MRQDYPSHPHCYKYQLCGKRKPFNQKKDDSHNISSQMFLKRELLKMLNKMCLAYLRCLLKDGCDRVGSLTINHNYLLLYENCQISVTKMAARDELIR